MKLAIVILVLISFLYSTLLPWDTTLILLIIRSLVTSDKSNYYLAFWFGLLNSYLLNQNLGILSLSYLLTVFIISQLKRSTLTFNLLSVMIIASTLILLHHGLKVLTGVSFNLNEVIAQILLTAPIYFLTLIWEERFVARPDFRLKL